MLSFALIFKLINLRKLNLSFTGIETVNPLLSKLSKLEKLNLAHNSLHELQITITIHNLMNLKNLNL